jgi:plasmid stabilization system protein ParE
MKRVVLRPRAEIDVIEVTQWYAEQGGQALAERDLEAILADEPAAPAGY